MPKSNKLWIDCIAGSQLRDSQGEMLSVEGADISDLEAGKGRWNDNHGKGFFNSIGRITEAKKIFKEEDCENDRHRYYWSKVKTPFVYAKGYLYNDEDHQNAKAAGAILRNIHKDDAPLKLKASVEGGVVQRGIKDPTLLKRTKIHSVALTFTPANQATLVEPLELNKSLTDEEHQADLELIKSVMHLAETNVPSFRHITRNASANKIKSNVEKMQKMLDELGIKKSLPEVDPQEIIEKAIEKKIDKNVQKINELVKMLAAGYGGAGAPTNLSGGGVFQVESLEDGKKKKKKKKKLKKSDDFKYVTCNNCGKEQVYMQHQVKCRECKKSLPFAKIFELING